MTELDKQLAETLSQLGFSASEISLARRRLQHLRSIQASDCGENDD
ncbi:hypothetical protein [Paracoccus jeotgali]|nr:hypothetical protein [Paracoccus jeotgali]